MIKQKNACIVFIDEIDAVGRHEAQDMEAEMTRGNRHLTNACRDGWFESNEGVILIMPPIDDVLIQLF